METIANRRTVPAAIHYLAGDAEGQVNYTQQHERSVLDFDVHTMPIHDIRNADVPPSLDTEGFIAARLPLRLDPEDSVEAIGAILLPPVEAYIKDLTGAAKVHVSPPVIRRSKGVDRFVRGPSVYVHSDYSREEFRIAVERGLKDDPERERWLAGRYSVIQIWRALTPPPQDFSLAMLDRRTVKADRVLPLNTVIGRPGEEVSYWNFALKHDPAHRWHYLSDMTEEDMLVFIGSESANTMPGVFHTGFDNRANVENPRPRISCETRAVVYWG